MSRNLLSAGSQTVSKNILGKPLSLTDFPYPVPDLNTVVLTFSIKQLCLLYTDTQIMGTCEKILKVGQYLSGEVLRGTACSIAIERGGIYMKIFNTTGPCIPGKHYMVDLSSRLAQIKGMVDAGQYFVINRARQYGKTTTLKALKRHLKDGYAILSLDFQRISSASFAAEGDFIQSLARIIMDAKEFGDMYIPEQVFNAFTVLNHEDTGRVRLDSLFRIFFRWCKESDRPIVLMIDEVDAATNNQVFLDFLAQLRDSYINRDAEGTSTFQSVILASVTDIKNLRRKIRPEEAHRFNSPWNIAADFNVDMSFSPNDIDGMLDEYEADHHTGMDVQAVAQEIYNFTNGYPFLVSRICQLIDREKRPWRVESVSNTVREILMEDNTLFGSIMNKVRENAELSSVLQDILFSGERISYNIHDTSISDATMYGFIRNDNGAARISNRIFETLLYDFYLFSDEMKSSSISKIGSSEKEIFVINGHLQMETILQRFVTVFDDLYHDQDAKFDEDEGRRRFLLFVRAIINGTGNYYIEAETRNRERMDLVIDYLGERFVVELKIWRGNSYNERGKQQLANYLDYYHLQKGYMLSFCFNKNKKPEVRHIQLGDKELVEAIV